MVIGVICAQRSRFCLSYQQLKMSSISKRRREGSRSKIKGMGDHKEFLKRITKTLYYGQLPELPCLSLPVTEISCELWSVSQRGRSLRRLHGDAAAAIGRSACVSPCALVLAILYLERLNACNPDYLSSTAPADLFLVTLMVSNKFLQDDGEDDEVFCAEWANSGGIELNQLKKLELEFLNAIDWNVYVSEKAFEAGLLWLERRVALKQAQLRGFFTYTDLSVWCDAELVGAALRALAAAGAAAAFASLTFLASTLLVSHACLSAAQHNAASAALPVPNDTNIIANDTLTVDASYVNDTAIDLDRPLLDTSHRDESVTADKLKSCAEWLKYRERNEHNYAWQESLLTFDWKSYETWWSKTSVLNWLYQSSLINPMQRWLEKLNEYASFYNREVLKHDSLPFMKQCYEHARLDYKQHCIRQWLNFSKLSALAVSVADR